MIDEMRTMEFVEEQGIRPPEVKGCYLCKCEEGEESILLPEGDDETIHLPLIKLRLYEIDMADGVKFGYTMNALSCLVNFLRNLRNPTNDNCEPHRQLTLLAFC